MADKKKKTIHPSSYLDEMHETLDFDKHLVEFEKYTGKAIGLDGKETSKTKVLQQEIGELVNKELQGMKGGVEEPNINFEKFTEHLYLAAKKAHLAETRGIFGEEAEKFEVDEHLDEQIKSQIRNAVYRATNSDPGSYEKAVAKAFQMSDEKYTLADKHGNITAMGALLQSHYTHAHTSEREDIKGLNFAKYQFHKGKLNVDDIAFQKKLFDKYNPLIKEKGYNAEFHQSAKAIDILNTAKVLKDGGQLDTNDRIIHKVYDPKRTQANYDKAA